jgi:zinc transport system substrate-binding protein
MIEIKRTSAVFSLVLAATLCFLPPATGGLLRPAKIRIMTTVFPLLEFAGEIAGDRGEVSLLLPPGAEVHSWQPRVSDIKKFAAIDVFIYIGKHLEPWAGEILRSTARPGLRSIEAGRESDPGDAAADADDPHVWLDFGRDQVLVDSIVRVLAELEPEAAGLFQSRADAYKTRLRDLDSRYRETFKTCSEKSFIFGGHAAFGYLARRYGLEQIPVFGLSPDSAPTPKAMTEIIALAKRRRIKTIFFEQNATDKMAKLIAREIGADTRVLNPGHNLTRKEFAAGVTFIALMDRNLESFKHGLACR